MNVIVPPQVYARERLTVRTEPLVVVEGVLERFASAGGAINLLVRRLAPLDAPDLLSRRPQAQVKDFSMLDARELARIALEQPRVAAAAAGGATAAHVRPPAPAARSAAPAQPLRRRPTAPARSAPARRGAPRPLPSALRPLPTTPPRRCPRAAPAPRTSGRVAPPIMSFAQGRRR